MDMCNLGSLRCLDDPKKPLERKDLRRPNNSDDDICQMEGDGFTTSTSEVKFNSVLIPDDLNKVCCSFYVFLYICLFSINLCFYFGDLTKLTLFYKAPCY